MLRASVTLREGQAVYVCSCKGVKFSDLVKAASERGSAPEDFIEAFGFDDSDSCGRCVGRIAKICHMAHMELARTKVDAAVA